MATSLIDLLCDNSRRVRSKFIQRCKRLRSEYFFIYLYQLKISMVHVYKHNQTHYHRGLYRIDYSKNFNAKKGIDLALLNYAVFVIKRFQYMTFSTRYWSCITFKYPSNKYQISSHNVNCHYRQGFACLLSLAYRQSWRSTEINIKKINTQCCSCDEKNVS